MNDGTGCSDYELQKNGVLKKKKRYSDTDAIKALTEARKHLSEKDLEFAETYLHMVPNIEIVENLEYFMNEKGLTLF
jgi:hypothetical protein